MSQEDAEGGEIISIFKKAGAYRESAKIPWHAEMTHSKIWHLQRLDGIGKAMLFLAFFLALFCFLKMIRFSNT